MKASFPFKVAAGYVFLVLVVCLASRLVYTSMNSLMLISREEDRLAERRSVADSLVHDFMDVSNNGQSIILGLVDDVREFDRSLGQAARHADMLKGMTDSLGQKERIDSLKALLALKRENTLMIRRAMELERDSRGAYFETRLTDLQEGRDSLVVYHPVVEERPQEPAMETVYEVVKSRKGFFARLGDAFRRQRADTVTVRRDTTAAAAVRDTVVHEIDIADSVAGVLAGIQAEEARMRRMGLDRLAVRERDLQALSVDLANRIGLLLEDIRKVEQESFNAAVESDGDQRRGIMRKVLFLAAGALLLAAVLLLLVWRDSRRARRYREGLEAAKAETERIMEQRERLLLTITHDIKAPAASIAGFTELATLHGVGPKASSYLASIRNSSTHLLRLVGQLLDYHRLVDGKVEVQQSSFSARKLVLGCVGELLPQAGSKEIGLVADVDGCGDTMLRGDALRISQVLENLVGNAVKYTQRGGVTVKAWVRGGKLCLTVEDTGQGMTKEECERAFEAFTRLPGSQGVEGVGLGLSITRDLVELLGGRISLESEKGRGTSFHVVLPVEVTDVEDLEGPGLEAGPRVEALSCGSMRVMVLDDDALQLRLLSEMLGMLTAGKWEVVTCQDAGGCLEALSGGGFGLLITDIEMPAMGGREIISRVDRDGMAVIGMTAHGRDIEASLLASGFDACLFKPFTIAELSDTLSRVVPGVAGNPAPPPAAPASGDAFGRYAPLAAFAGDDDGAAREILSCFLADLEGNAESFRRALDTGDRHLAAQAAHRAMPSLSMVGARCVGALGLLSEANVPNVSDGDFAACVRGVIDELGEMALELGGLLGP